MIFVISPQIMNKICISKKQFDSNSIHCKVKTAHTYCTCTVTVRYQLIKVRQKGNMMTI